MMEESGKRLLFYPYDLMPVQSSGGDERDATDEKR